MLDEAQAILEPLARTWPTYHYHLACCLALRIPPASPGRTALAVEDSQNYGDRAMVELRQAVAGDIKPLEDYRTDPNLDPLRGREDFRAVLMDLAFPVDPLAR